jgi:hypothetical protein
MEKYWPIVNGPFVPPLALTKNKVLSKDSEPAGTISGGGLDAFESFLDAFFIFVPVVQLACFSVNRLHHKRTF